MSRSKSKNYKSLSRLRCQLTFNTLNKKRWIEFRRDPIFHLLGWIFLTQFSVGIKVIKIKVSFAQSKKMPKDRFESDSSEQMIPKRVKTFNFIEFIGERIHLQGHNISISTNELLTSSCYISTMVNQGSADSFRIESHWNQSLNFWFRWYI